jgi:hypothetical protein
VKVVTLAGGRHFFIRPPVSEQPKPPDSGLIPTPVIMVAHYDRVPGSPGANDNSAAVFELIEAALSLCAAKADGWFIIFTDKEEIEKGKGIRTQGAYMLARGLKKAGLSGGRCYIFDACGSGDALVISTAADHLLESRRGRGISQTKKTLEPLRAYAERSGRAVFGNKLYFLPAPFSDDAGFFRAGLSAQTITVLPSTEAAHFTAELLVNHALAGALFTREGRDPHSVARLPETWQRLNGERDTFECLTPAIFPRVAQFAAALCGNRP